MPTPAERHALLFIGAIACLGGGVRVLRARSVPPPSPEERRAIEMQLAAVDSTRRAKAGIRGAPQGKQDSAKKAKPVGVAGITPRVTELRIRPVPTPKHKLDMDAATAAEIQDLPGIGPTIAARIVANRDSNGPFGSLTGLQRVKGVGHVTAARLDSIVWFSGTPRGVTHPVVATSDSSAAARKRKPSRPP